MHTRYRSLHLSIVGAPSRAVAYNIAKQQNIRCIASSPTFLWYGSIEWNMEENLLWNGIWKKILVWNGKWNGRFLVWSGRKLLVWKMENRLPFYSIPMP